MRTEEFIKLLAEPYTVEEFEVDDLRELAEQYPYSQVIQLLYGLRLRYSSGHLFNQQLGRAAALSNDRSVLFELFENKPKPSINPTPLSVVSEEVPTQKEEELEAETQKIDLEAVQAAQEQASEVPIEEEEVSPEPEEEDAEEESLEIAQNLDTVVAETKSPQIDKPSEEELAAQEAAQQKEEIPPLPDLSELSPQDRVKAILERNKAIRAQFEAERKSGVSEKLFSESTTEKATDSQNSPDEPIDIASLVQRRHESQFGKPEESTAEVGQESEEELVSDEAQEEPKTEDVDSKEEVAEKSEAQDQGDIALTTRIRIIRDRLEALKESDALTDEELEALMEEHKRLESLMTELPLDEDHVFAIELESEEDEPKEQDEVAESAEDNEPEEMEDSAEKEQETAAEDEEKAEAIEQKEARSEAKEPETASETESETQEEEEDEAEDALDSEIKRIERLAAQLKSDPSSKLDMNRLNAMREERLRKLEEEAKQLNFAETAEDAEEKELAEPAAEETIESSVSGDETAEAEENTAVPEEEDGVEDLADSDAEAELEESSKTEGAEAESKSVAEVPSAEAKEELEEVPEENTTKEEESEAFSFSEWLQKVKEGKAQGGPREEVKAKVDLLDSFVEKLPDLKKQSRQAAASKSASVNNPVPEREESDGLGMVTETLAKVYIKQKHYKKAIQAYEILKLKYPEKSSFFASQILEIKKLAKSN